MQLKHKSKDTDISGTYERFRGGEPDFYESGIDVLLLNDTKVYLDGLALWYSDQEETVMHSDEINLNSIKKYSVLDKSIWDSCEVRES